MSKRHNNNQLPNNLPQLQNLIKRDPESYKDEFAQQYRHFESTLAVFELNPGEYNKSLHELVTFLSQIAKCFPEELKNYPQTLFDILRKHSTVLDPDMRMSLCKALILLRHKDLLCPSELLKLFFDLLKCRDKSLRKFLKDHIINDLKTVNSKSKDVRLNSSLQNFMFTMLKDSHKIAAKTSLDVMIELYKRNVWKDSKTVNVIATGCFADVTKISVTAIKFFLGCDNDDDDGDGDDVDDGDDDVKGRNVVLPSIKDIALANKVNKKSKKRERFLENLKKAHLKKRKKEKTESLFNFSALHLIHDPQGFAEKMFKRMDDLKERFEVKILYLDLISRLIGTHQLFILHYYSYISRFLTPHQRDVIQMLQFAAQAAHELVPPDAIEPVLRAIAHNFITERNSSEVMAVGLNAVRELCKRCPLAIDETLLRDLAMYKSYKDKGVMMAARSLIQLYRVTYPELLHKKDRGRPTEAVAELSRKAYGELDAKDFVPGAEVLNIERETEDERGFDESDWEDVSHSDDDDDDDDDDDGDEGEKEIQSSENLTLEEKKQRAMRVVESRILTDADFRKIDSTQLKKQVTAFRKGGKKRKFEEEEEKVTSNSTREELVDLANIEMIYKKRKHDKESRMESVKEGRDGREKYGSKKGKNNENTGTSNKVKNKKKNFAMMKHKLKFKAKRSFVDKQKHLKRALLRSKKFK